uniref:Uncharacterized protein n=1 Tax=Rousettus aegyptiacus TaxID=9407 RepID=A0A7J8DIX0_ROUAE|nr:hypothetical protein HJG63_008725 [Rousettus aegyptiacus]
MQRGPPSTPRALRRASRELRVPACNAGRERAVLSCAETSAQSPSQRTSAGRRPAPRALRRASRELQVPACNAGREPAVLPRIATSSSRSASLGVRCAVEAQKAVGAGPATLRWVVCLGCSAPAQPLAVGAALPTCPRVGRPRCCRRFAVREK